MHKKVLLALPLLFCVVLPAFAQLTKEQWVDSVFQRLSPEQKVGQLFMLPTAAYLSDEELASLLEKVSDYQPGGILITHGGPVSHARLVNKLQQSAKVPLFIGINAEWGLAQTLDSTMRFPKPMILSAVSDTLVKATGRVIGEQMKLLGIHINFAPNADTDLKREIYPVSQYYFSDDPRRATRKSIAFMEGLMQAGVLPCAKHYPDQNRDKVLARQASRKRKKDVDSMSYVNASKLDTAALYPYRRLFQKGLPALLTTNLHFSTFDRRTPIPASISQLFVSDVLKKQLGFQGLTFTQIPYLQKISGKTRGGETELIALTVGNDVLIDPQNITAAMRRILREVNKNKMLGRQLDASVKKILAAKYEAGLHTPSMLNTDNLALRLHGTEAKVLAEQLALHTLTTIKNEGALPVTRLEDQSFATLVIGKEENNTFNRYLNKYAHFQPYTVRTVQDTVGLLARLRAHDVIVVSVFPLGTRLENPLIDLLRQLPADKQVIVCHFADPLSLSKYSFFNAVIAAYSDETDLQRVAAQVVFGAAPTAGQLPVNVSQTMRAGHQVSLTAVDRFMYTLPELAEMDSRTLQQIDAVAREAIDAGATPGCHVLVARKGKVVYEKSYGWLTYKNQQPVTEETIYDLASVTKVSATLQAVMFMHEKGLIDINKKASYYLPELRATNKRDFILKDILTHQAGLWPFLPFWTNTVRDSLQLKYYYSQRQSADYPYPVADSLYAFSHMRDSIWQWILKARVINKAARTPYDYRYSDMGFYILQHLAEKMLNQPLEDFLQQNIYDPIGAYTTGYLPRQKFDAARIAPTERDSLFRQRLLVGYVHDQGAAMHGGVAGHAGLFSTANDLAKLGQMWLNGGHYGSVEVFKPETLELFTARQYKNSRRALGWDKPAVSDWNGPTSVFASPATFGHTGFTGTCIWVDPTFDLVFVFLSNRVHPIMTNNKILNLNIRPRIHDAVYRAIFNFCATEDTIEGEAPETKNY